MTATDFACPSCGAKPGEPCSSGTGSTRTAHCPRQRLLKDRRRLERKAADWGGAPHPTHEPELDQMQQAELPLGLTLV